jgi:hypothetical protein
MSMPTLTIETITIIGLIITIIGLVIGWVFTLRDLNHSVARNEILKSTAKRQLASDTAAALFSSDDTMNRLMMPLMGRAAVLIDNDRDDMLTAMEEFKASIASTDLALRNHNMTEVITKILIYAGGMTKNEVKRLIRSMVVVNNRS